MLSRALLTLFLLCCGCYCQNFSRNATLGLKPPEGWKPRPRFPVPVPATAPRTEPTPIKAWPPDQPITESVGDIGFACSLSIPFWVWFVIGLGTGVLLTVVVFCAVFCTKNTCTTCVCCNYNE